MKKLTKKQQAILDYIAEFQKSEGMAPTVYEIADSFELKTSTVFAHIRALQRKGELTRTKQARSIKLTRLQVCNNVPATVSVPLEDSSGEIGTVYISQKLAENSAFMAFEIPDDSMSEFGIFKEDVVIIEMNGKPKAGDMVVAEVPGAVMLRSFYPSSVIADSIELRPADRNYQSQRYSQADVKIRGIVVGLQRQY